MQAYLDNDCFIGITGWVSDKRRNTELIEAIEYLPIERLLIETDCPYLTPFNIKPRPRRNEPQFLNYIAKSISEIKNIPLQEVLDITYANTLDFFSLNTYNNDYQQKKKI